MSNKKITDLPELTNPTTDDVFPIVDIATNTTQKVQVGNLPVQTAVTTALATKQDTLVSGTNIKTVNSTSLVGSGNVAVQDTLVSGTNIKTINSTSLLGSGNIAVVTSPSGVAGAIQFSNGSAFASDASNLFWDDTNKRLGVGTNAPTSNFDVKSTATSFVFAQFLANNGNEILTIRNNSDNSGNILAPNVYAFSIGTNTTTARLTVKGSGSTSATTSLLVQNSAGSQLLKVADNGETTIGIANSGIFTVFSQYGFIYMNAGNYLGYGFSADETFTYRNASNVSQWKLGNQGNAVFNGTMAVGNSASPVASAQLEITSTTRGFLPPRMTTTQRNAIATPAEGLVIYNTTTQKLNLYTTAWEAITSL